MTNAWTWEIKAWERCSKLCFDLSNCFLFFTLNFILLEASWCITICTKNNNRICGSRAHIYNSKAAVAIFPLFPVFDINIVIELQIWWNYCKVIGEVVAPLYNFLSQTATCRTDPLRVEGSSRFQAFPCKTVSVHCSYILMVLYDCYITMATEKKL